MIVSVSGFGFSGASGVVDLLREFDDVYFIDKKDFEFQIIKAPDGLLDLYYSVVVRNNFLSANAGIKRFKRMMKENSYFSPEKKFKKGFKRETDKFIDHLNSVSWSGKSSFDPLDLKSFFGKKQFSFLNKVVNKTIGKVFKSFTWPLKKKRYYAHLTHNDFSNVCRDYLYSLMAVLGFDTQKIIVLDQLFDASDPTLCLNIFGDSKMIIVDRDPRDVYLLSNYYYPKNASFMLNNKNVDSFVWSFVKTRSDCCDTDRLIKVAFEDLVLNYESTKINIMKFLGLAQIKREFTTFNPAFSIANIGLFLKNQKHANEINKISVELSNYCYPFSKEQAEEILKAKNNKMFK